MVITLFVSVCISSFALSSVIPEDNTNVTYKPYLSLRSIRLRDITEPSGDFVFSFNVDESVYSPSQYLVGDSIVFDDVIRSYSDVLGKYSTIQAKSTYSITESNAKLNPFRTAFIRGYEDCLYTPNQTWVYDSFILTPEIVGLFSGDNIGNTPYLALSFERNEYLPSEIYCTYIFTVSGVDKDSNIISDKLFRYTVTESAITTVQYKFGLYMANFETMYNMITEELQGESFYITSYRVDISTNGTVPPTASSKGTKITSLVHFTNVANFSVSFSQYLSDFVLQNGANADVGVITNAVAFVSSAAANFFSIELFPNFSLGGILAVVISISVMIMILKFFAGG